MRDAVSGGSLNSLRKSIGEGPFMAAMIRSLAEVDAVCGGASSDQALAIMATLVFDRFKFRTANALRMALHDGMNAGKLYGKLTYPVIAEWLTNHEDAAEQDSFNSHQGLK
jgi:ethanolamine transporter EutH